MWKKIDEEILNIIKGDLKKIGILKEEEIEKYKIIRLKNIYPITNKDEFNIQEMVDWINSFKNEFFINAVVDAGKVDQFMKKQIQKVMAVFTIASVLVMGFLATFLSFSALQVSKYNFELAEPIKAMSSEYTQYAVAEDGTMLKRVLFEGGIADFIVKFSGNIASFIAIDASQVQNMLAFNALDFGAFAASVPETGKKIFYSRLN